jgi:hypothetical protein
MNRLISILLAICCAAPAFAAEQPLIEVFGCKLNEGRTMADFNNAAEFWRAQIDKIPAAANYLVALLTPMRGNTPYDILWVGTNPSVSDWAKSQEAQSASSEMAAAAAEIDANVSCESALYFETPIYEGLKDEASDNDAVIETYGCNLKPGKTQKDADADDAANLAATKALKPTSYSTYRWTPFFAKASYDVVYLTVNDNLASFAAATEAFDASKEGRAALQADAATFTCDSGLWLGRTLRAPAAAPDH